jgi:predicted glutamine amidotransferase
MEIQNDYGGTSKVCIAIYKPQGTRIYASTLEACWNSNSDGAGFAYVEDKKLHVIKGLMTYNDFIEAYIPHETKQLLLHFRIATHGGITEEMTHPFLIDDNLALIHNGIINKINTEDDKTKSDTWHFIEQYLKSFRTTRKNFWLLPEYQYLIEDFIGHSKLAFLDNHGRFKIYNENLGHWNSDCWFSNYSYNWSRTTYSGSRKVQYVSPTQTTGTDWYTKEVKSNFSKEETDNILMLQDLKIGKFVKNNTILPMYGQDYNKGIHFPEGTIFIITSFLNATQIWLREVQSGIATCAPLYKLDSIKELPKDLFDKEEEIAIGTEVIFTANYNHFRIGNVRKVVSVTNKYIYVDDFSKEKTYPIPKAILEPKKPLVIESTSSQGA